MNYNLITMKNTTKTATGTNENRDADGKYTYGKFERVCRCGRRLAEHDAARPYAFGDYSMDPRNLPDCAGFKPAKGNVYMTEAEFVALVAAYEAEQAAKG